MINAQPNRSAQVAEQIYELRITLCDTKPPIWRRVAVPADITLGQLHDVIQIAMGWANSHLHLFIQYRPATKQAANDLALASAKHEFDCDADARFRRQTFGPTGYDLDAENENKAILDDVLPDVKSKLDYIYDLGDGWEHSVEVQKIYEAEPNVAYPKCLAGKKACPPEDCGGVWGYCEMLEALPDSEHERHEELVEWIGAFDPDAFDPDEVNQMLTEWFTAQPRRRGRKSTERADDST